MKTINLLTIYIYIQRLCTFTGDKTLASFVFDSHFTFTATLTSPFRLVYISTTYNALAHFLRDGGQYCPRFMFEEVT